MRRARRALPIVDSSTADEDAIPDQRVSADNLWRGGGARRVSEPGTGEAHGSRSPLLRPGASGKAGGCAGLESDRLWVGHERISGAETVAFGIRRRPALPRLEQRRDRR